ncbi:MAG: recombinase family protein [Actinomycetota bacterium]
MARRNDSVNDRVRDRILEMAAEGASSRTIAERLNASEVQTSRGGRWHSSTVAGVIRRAKS